jgi:hypothetical protein
VSLPRPEYFVSLLKGDKLSKKIRAMARYGFSRKKIRKAQRRFHRWFRKHDQQFGNRHLWT